MNIDTDRRYICPGPCQRCWAFMTPWTLCPWCENGQRNALLEDRAAIAAERHLVLARTA